MTGGTTWPAWRPVIMGWLALLVLLVGFGTWAANARIAGAIIAPGRIVVAHSPQVVQHPEGGVVTALLVSEGQRVAEGEVLLRLDDVAIGAELAQVETRLFEVMARRARLEAERDGAPLIRFDPLLRQRAKDRPALADIMAGQRRLMQARAASLEQELAQLDIRQVQAAKASAGIAAQLAALKHQLQLIRQELDAQQSLLQQGLAQMTRVLALRREKARLRGAVGELQARDAELADRAAGIELEILRLKAQRREAAITQLRDLQAQERSLRQERHRLQTRLSHRQVVAPLGGVVHDLRVPGPQAVVPAAAPILTIVPKDRPAMIQARIAPTDIDAVYPNQAVRLRFPALDKAATPQLDGRIASVSADALLDPASGLAYYQARITLSAEAAAPLPDGARLIPGMPVEAYIRTGDHRPAAYLIKPMSDYFARAFR